LPKVSIGQWTQKDKEFSNILRGGLIAHGKDYKELVRRTGKSHSTIYTRYHKPETITVEELRIFIQLAGLSKESVLKLLFKDE